MHIVYVISMGLPDLDKYYAASVTYRDVGVSNLKRYFFGDADSVMADLYQRGLQCVILQTCNRVEIYSYGGDPIDIFGRAGVYDEFRSAAHVYRGIDVFRHLIYVVSGLDSLAVGEPQIMGQVRRAYNHARDLGFVGGELEYLFSEAFKVGRRVRARIMFRVFDYAYATVEIVGRYIDGKRLLIIGTGDMAKDLLGILVNRFRGRCKLYVAGRSRLDWISSRYGVETLHISRLPDYIGLFDVVVSCVSSDKPIIDKSYRDRIKDGAVIVDLGVPPNVSLDGDGFTVYKFEDISRMISQYYGSLSDKISLLYGYVEEELARLRDRFRLRWVNEVIRQIYIRAEEIRREELDEAYREIGRIISDEEVRRALYKLLDTFSWSLIKKIYHGHIEVFRRLGKNAKVNREVLMLLLNSLAWADESCT